jgi:hypothetical protein
MHECTDCIVALPAAAAIPLCAARVSLEALVLTNRSSYKLSLAPATPIQEQYYACEA